jgi:hypothetical protein
MGICIPIPKLSTRHGELLFAVKRRTAGKDPQKTRNTIMETQNKVQDAPWYETAKFSTLQEKQLQKKCDSVSTELCNEASEKGMQLPFKIEFMDARRIFAEMTEDEEKINWKWHYNDERLIEPLIAVLKGRNRQSLRQNFSLNLSEKELLARLNDR